MRDYEGRNSIKLPFCLRYFSIQGADTVSQVIQVIGLLAPSKFDCKVIFPDNNGVPQQAEPCGVG